MLNFQSIYTEVMDALESARNAGRLIGLTEILEQEQQLTTHNSLEKLEALLTYQLRPLHSASEITEEVLNTGKIFLNGGVALHLAYYQIILKAMKMMYGAQEAKKRFDILFGSVDECTPAYRRWTISPYNIVTGLASQWGGSTPNSLSYFAKIKSVPGGETIDSIVDIGAQVIFKGYSDYFDKYPHGSDGVYFCFVTHCQPLRVRGFGLGKSNLTEMDLVARHKAAYFSSSDRKSQKSAVQNETIGFANIAISIDEIKLMTWLRQPVEDMVKILDVACNAKQSAIARDVVELTKKMKTTTLSEVPLQRTLPRLTGVFSKLTIKTTAFDRAAFLLAVKKNKYKTALSLLQCANITEEDFMFARDTLWPRVRDESVLELLEALKKINIDLGARKIPNIIVYDQQESDPYAKVTPLLDSIKQEGYLAIGVNHCHVKEAFMPGYAKLCQGIANEKLYYADIASARDLNKATEEYKGRLVVLLEATLVEDWIDKKALPVEVFCLMKSKIKLT